LTPAGEYTTMKEHSTESRMFAGHDAFARKDEDLTYRDGAVWVGSDVSQTGL